MDLLSALLSPRSKTIKKNPPRKNFFIFQEMELSGSKIKKFLIFQEIELSSSNIKKFLIFLQKKSFSYISGNGTFLYCRKWKPGKNSLCFKK